MNYLLRMSLFLAALSALCLAVMAWSISQWAGTMTSGTVEMWSVQTVLCDRGVVTAVDVSFGEPWAYKFLPPEEIGEALCVFNPREQDLARFNHVCAVPGINCLADDSVTLVSVRHRFITTAFALFYACLKLFYQRRSETVPADG